jgi:acetyl esterase
MPLHPFIVTMLKKLEGRPALSDGEPSDARMLIAATRTAMGPGPDVAKVIDIAVPGRSGAIPTRVYMPSATPTGVVTYMHGGGWVIGAIEDFDALARALAVHSGCAVVLPDYRLAPEHRFPAGLDDCEDVVHWVARERNRLFGADLAIVIAGDSAGANLATVVACRIRGQIALAAQILIYPVTDCKFDTTSYRQHSTGFPLTRRDMMWFFEHYAPEAQWTSQDIAIMRADDLRGLPPTLIVTAEYDVLADEGRAYFERLIDAGVDVQHRQVPGVPHGFIRLHNLFDVARAELIVIAAYAARACDA